MRNKLIFYLIERFLLMMLTSIIMSGCAYTPEQFRSNLQNNIKTRVAKIDSFGDTKLEYLTSRELKKEYAQDQSSNVRRSNLGAIKLGKVKNFSEPNKKEETRIVTFYRRNKSISAETKLFETKNKKFFFSFGLEKKFTAPKIGFKMEF